MQYIQTRREGLWKKRPSRRRNFLKGETEMKPLGGFTQNELDALWNSLNDPSVQKIIDDEREQVMTLTTTAGALSVSRRPGAEWSDTPTVGDRDDS